MHMHLIGMSAFRKHFLEWVLERRDQEELRKAGLILSGLLWKCRSLKRASGVYSNIPLIDRNLG